MMILIVGIIVLLGAVAAFLLFGKKNQSKKGSIIPKDKSSDITKTVEVYDDGYISFFPDEEAVKAAVIELKDYTSKSKSVLPESEQYVWLITGKDVPMHDNNCVIFESSFKQAGYSFCYYRRLFEDLSKETIQYNFPNSSIDMSRVSESAFNNAIESSLGIEISTKSRFLIQYVPGKKVYRVLDLTSDDIKSYFTHLVAFEESLPKRTITEEEQPSTEFELEGTLYRRQDGYKNPRTTLDPASDEAFEYEMTHIVQGAKEKLKELQLSGLSKEILKKLVEELEEPLSRITITRDFRILLKDMNNREVEIKQLPKTLFLFFLKYDHGFMRGDLLDYKKELMSIYDNVTIHSDQEAREDSIDKLIDPFNNSFNEKCSTIKHAFLLAFPDNIAKNYYIYGKKGEKKAIALDRSMVEWEKKL